MIHPAFIALARQPGLVIDHADAYLDLASAELDEWSGQWKRRAGLGVTAAVLAGIGLLLGGVALLALAVVPVSDMPLPWLLLVVPLVPLLAAAALAAYRHRLVQQPAFAELRQQLAQDLATLRILENE